MIVLLTAELHSNVSGLWPGAARFQSFDDKILIGGARILQFRLNSETLCGKRSTPAFTRQTIILPPCLTSSRSDR
jgi:hypothetical protein